MAINPVPEPVLDTRDEAQIVAQAIGSLPSELSDRSDSNPAVVILEAAGAILGRLLYQINRWPHAVIQKALSLVGVTLLPAQSSTVSQSFTLTAPQPTDTIIPQGTQVSDGSAQDPIVFSTLSDVTIPSYENQVGIITITSGSTAVTGTGTTFVTDGSWTGRMIRAINGTWYTIASVATTTSLTLTASATSSALAAYQVGEVTATVTAQSDDGGLDTQVGAGILTTLVSSVIGVGSTTNAAAATGGADEETAELAIARAPTAFATRDVACTADDHAYFAEQILGQGGRARALANTNGVVTTAGYVTVAALSPSWTVASSISAAERAAIVRDLQARTFAGAAIVDVAAIVSDRTVAGAIPAVAVYRKAAYDTASARVAVAQEINGLCSPNTYDWGRALYLTDGIQAAEAATAVDRVHSISGVPAFGWNYQTSASAVTWVNASASVTVTAANFATATNGKSFLVDAVNSKVYLITAGAGTGTLTIDRAFEDTGYSAVASWFTAADQALTNWYTLPYSNLSTSLTSPAASVIVVGAV